MAKGKTKNIKSLAKRAYKQSQNFKHSSVLNRNIKYSKKEIETILFTTMHDQIYIILSFFTYRKTNNFL